MRQRQDEVHNEDAGSRNNKQQSDGSSGSGSDSSSSTENGLRVLIVDIYNGNDVA